MKNEITAKRLQNALSDKNMKPQELADKSGVSKASISQYVNGSHAPSNISSDKMAKVLNVNPLWLMGFDVPMEPSLSPKESSDDTPLKTLSDFVNSHPDSIGYLAILCKNERIERDYTEKSIAQKCNITLREYLDFENSCKNIGITKIGSILLFFDFNITFILGYLVGATGSQNEMVEIMVSQASEKDKDNMKYIASQMVKMDSEELNYLVELLKHDLPENETNTQKFTKAMYDFHKTQHKDEA
ncbi:MAG: helix-turn-helix domain-containing protein [Lachnospiraceae bacterium]|nr:helix-turn-helix domain-containing protein [Lachnospiraceae bacterium]